MSSSTRRLAHLAAGALPVLLAAALLPGDVAGRAVADAPATAPSFLTTAPRVSGRAAATVAPSHALRERLVGLRTSLAPARAHGQRISFPLFGDTTFTGTVQTRHTGPGYTVWTGPLTAALGSFVISRSGDTYRVSLSAPAGDYEITQASGDAYWVSQTDETGDPGGTDEVAVTDGAPGLTARRATSTTPRTVVSPRAARRHDGPGQFDVLFLYTPGALAEAGGSPDAMNALIGTVAGQTNQALASSRTHLQMRVAGVREIKGPDGGLSTVLARLRKTKDSYYRSAGRLRNRYHADIVHLIVGGSSNVYCGLGYLKLPHYNYSHYAFSTSYLSCAPYYTISHELGHNLGADHDRYPGVTNYSKLPYSHGLVNVAAQWRTIMAYPNRCYDAGIQDGCTRLLSYSNPTTTYNGNKLGSRRHAYNAKAIRQFRGDIAQYRLGNVYHPTVRVTGRKQVGRVLTVQHGHWTTGGKHIRFTYRWLIGGAPIPHRHGRHLRIKASYFGHRIRAVVVGHVRTYPATPGSHKITGIRKARFAHTTRPRIVGTPRVGRVVHLRVRHFRPSPQTIKVIWLRNGHRIAHQHGTRLRLTKKDKGKTIRATVKLRHHGYVQVVKHTTGIRVHHG